MNENYAQPDPAWDYNAIYQQACQAHAKLEELLKLFVSPDYENATPEGNEAIASLLDEAQEAINSARSKLKSSSPEPKHWSENN